MHIYLESSILRNSVNQDEIALVGAMYDVYTGEVEFKDYSAAISELNQEYAHEINLQLSKTMDACQEKVLPILES